MGIIPPMPDLPGTELSGFPPEVRRFHFTDLKGAVTEELRVPLRETKLPRNCRTTPFALPFVPAAIHRPIPGKRSAILAGEHGFNPGGCPVLEPVREFLDRREVRIEINRVHRAEIARSMMINDPAGIQ